MTSIYDFSLENQQGEEISLEYGDLLFPNPTIPWTTISLPALPGIGD